MADIPALAAPFRIVNGDVAVVEQDSAEDIGACAFNIAVCPVGFRIDLPDFGIPDPTFQTMPVDVSPISAALSRWEPRADLTLRETIDAVNDALTISVAVAPAQKGPDG